MTRRVGASRRDCTCNDAKCQRHREHVGRDASLDGIGHRLDDADAEECLHRLPARTTGESHVNGERKPAGGTPCWRVHGCKLVPGPSQAPYPKRSSSPCPAMPAVVAALAPPGISPHPGLSPCTLYHCSGTVCGGGRSRSVRPRRSDGRGKRWGCGGIAVPGTCRASPASRSRATFALIAAACRCCVLSVCLQTMLWVAQGRAVQVTRAVKGTDVVYARGVCAGMRRPNCSAGYTVPWRRRAYHVLHRLAPRLAAHACCFVWRNVAGGVGVR